MIDRRTAYEKWLGIKSHDQPPTLYRLLGLDALESDLDAISNAADSRMAFLRQFQVCDNGPLAEDILNEVSKARVTLLNADKKTAYDADLRQRIAAQAAAVASANLPVDFDDLSPPHADPMTAPVLPGRKKSVNSLLWVAPAASVALVAVVAAFVNSPRGGEGSPNKDTTNTVAEHSETTDKPKLLAAAESPKVPAKQAPAATASGPAANEAATPVVETATPITETAKPTAETAKSAAEAGKPAAEADRDDARIKVERARWGGGSHWIDVTQRVQEALDLHKWVWASTGFLKKDPTPGWRKRLQITLEKDGERRTIWLNEGKHWAAEQFDGDKNHDEAASNHDQPTPPTSSAAANKDAPSPAEKAPHDADVFPAR